MPNARVALIVCCKWEERYIAEFLEHYRDVVKVDKVFLADNNDVGYSPDIREVIAPFMREGFVEYCDYRGVEDVQHACYSEVFFRIKDDFDWVAIFDADEFLDLGEFECIQDYLAQDMFADADCVQIPWIVMKSPLPAIRYRKGPVAKRLSVPNMTCFASKSYPKLKTIIRCDSRAKVARVSLHHCEFEGDDYVCRLWNGERKMDCADIIAMPPQGVKRKAAILNHYNIHLKHYQYKSAEEFMEKVFRGRASQRAKKAYYKEKSRAEVIDMYIRLVRYGWFANKYTAYRLGRMYDEWMKRKSAEQQAASESVSREELVSQRAERLDRGLVAMASNGGVYLSWRMLASEDHVFGQAAKPASYTVMRDGAVIAELSATTNFFDCKGTPASTYAIAANGGEACVPTRPFVSGANWFDIPLVRPADSPYGPYEINDVSCGDLDGDGSYELVVKWDSAGKDNAEPGFTGNVLIDAYKLDGTRLWEQPIDLGCNIRAGAHYTQFLVYDFDRDGLAELIMKTAPGSCDANGAYVSQASVNERIRACDDTADFRNEDGIVIMGDEFLTVFSGATGAALDTIYYPNQRIESRCWGDNYGNRSERYTACVTWIDGKRPHGFFMRGYYWDIGNKDLQRQAACAVAFDGKRLSCESCFDTLDVDAYERHDEESASFDEKGVYKGVKGYRPGNEIYAGQGNHNCIAADVDGDGRDEVLTGALCYELKGDGTLGVRWCTHRGHGDAMHLMARPDGGFDFFTVHEGGGTNPILGNALDYGMSVLDANSGRELLHRPSPGDMGRGMMADVGAGGRYQIWGVSEVEESDERVRITPLMRTDAGFEDVDIPGASSNFRIFWDGTLRDNLLDGAPDGPLEVTAWDGERMQPVFCTEGCTSINGTKANPCLQADILGDWREELVMARADNEALRVFVSDVPTEHSLMTLMHDPVYRAGVAAEQTAYNQPPHIGFHLDPARFSAKPYAEES